MVSFRDLKIFYVFASGLSRCFSRISQQSYAIFQNPNSLSVWLLASTFKEERGKEAIQSCQIPSNFNYPASEEEEREKRKMFLLVSPSSLIGLRCSWHWELPRIFIFCISLLAKKYWTCVFGTHTNLRASILGFPLSPILPSPPVFRLRYFQERLKSSKGNIGGKKSRYFKLARPKKTKTKVYCGSVQRR